MLFRPSLSGGAVDDDGDDDDDNDDKSKYSAACEVFLSTCIAVKRQWRCQFSFYSSDHSSFGSSEINLKEKKIDMKNDHNWPFSVDANKMQL